MVVIIGIPVIFLALWVGWLIVRPKVVAQTGGRMQSVWTDDGPRYGAEAVGELDPDDRNAHDDVPPDEAYRDIKP